MFAIMRSGFVIMENMKTGVAIMKTGVRCYGNQCSLLWKPVFAVMKTGVRYYENRCSLLRKPVSVVMKTGVQS